MLALLASFAALAAPGQVTWGPDWVQFDGKDLYRSSTKTENGEEHTDTYEPLSIVGTLVSVQHGYYHDGGAHPALGSRFLVVDATTNRPVSLRTLFGETAVFEALRADKVIQGALKDPKPADLDALLASVDGGCDMKLGPALLESFAFHHVKDGRVAVRIGVTHGCEASRGQFNQLGVYLPIPTSLAPALAAADQRGSLMEDLASK